jgi:hypothetical protein
VVFVDGSTRPVFLDPDGRQYVLDDDGRQVYGLWIFSASTDDDVAPDVIASST